MDEPQQLELLTARLVSELYDGMDALVSAARAELTMPEPEARHVYHYTTLSSFLAMSGGGPYGYPWSTVWASSMAYLNDKQEFLHGHTLMQAAWSEALTQEGDKLVRGILEAGSCAMSDEDLHWHALDVYVASLSKHGDQLSQWRGYADFGRGVSIGLNLERLRKTIQSDCFWVIYEEDLQKLVAQAIMSNIQTGLQTIVTNANQDKVREEVIKWIPRFMSTVYARLKHPAFQEESEFRLCYVAGLQPIFKDRKFRARGASLVPYLELTFSNPGSLSISGRVPIEEVILGPAASWKANEASLRMFLDINRQRMADDGEQVEIRQSKVPLV
jgi:hypothetical protein